MALDDYFTTDGKVSCREGTGTVFNFCRYVIFIIKAYKFESGGFRIYESDRYWILYFLPFLCLSTLSLAAGSISIGAANHRAPM